MKSDIEKSRFEVRFPLRARRSEDETEKLSTEHERHSDSYGIQGHCSVGDQIYSLETKILPLSPDSALLTS